MNAVFAVCINRNMQMAKMVIAVLFACWVQLKEKRYRAITGLVVQYESLDFFFEARIFSMKF